MPDTFDFEIYFFGLICIHGSDPKRGAARKKKVEAFLLEDADHTPLIYLNSEQAKYELKRRSKVDFVNVGKGEATILNSFDDLVPHLEDVTRYPTQLNPRAYGVRAELPAGRLVAVATYPYQGEYYLDGEKIERKTDCIARLTMLNVKTLRPEVRVIFESTSRNENEPVPATGFVLIANSELQNVNNPPPGGGRTLRPGFKKHATATDHGPQYLADLYELDGQTCETPIENPPDIHAVHLKEVLSIVRQYPVFNHPECSNTNWP